MNNMQRKILLDIKLELEKENDPLLDKFDSLFSQGDAKVIFVWLNKQIRLEKLPYSAKNHMTDLYYAVR
ncbi:hypothetical protein CWI84_06165 [Idiomarina tyrosinivorans]|uniref:Uncharacterized protein n=1 Tax=Idiomarina tyrosinivorans TaxID=1445662 RepID=A0A432ZQW1_9GAMM|nr:hypothetical protein [Idiomarina tyrosinivorans]RUO80216.1 hypothetical protein CWI84_06165 [Idiomarina tyrosinivorans]